MARQATEIVNSSVMSTHGEGNLAPLRSDGDWGPTLVLLSADNICLYCVQYCYSNVPRTGQITLQQCALVTVLGPMRSHAQPCAVSDTACLSSFLYKLLSPAVMPSLHVIGVMAFPQASAEDKTDKDGGRTVSGGIRSGN